MNSLTRAGRIALTYALALLSASCSSDSPSAPPAANLTVTASATTITASDPVALRLGGSPVDSLGAVTLGGAAISAGEEGIVGFGPEFAQGGAYVRCITDINQ